MLNDNKYITDYNIPSNGFVHVSIADNIGINMQQQKTNKDFSNDDIDYNNFDDGMDDEAFARMLQQREIQQNNNNNNNGINNGIGYTRNSRMEQRDFACGLLLGMMVGIWVFIFLLFIQRSYSRRFRLGVMLGVFINIIFQLSTTQQQLSQNNDNNDNIDNIDSVDNNNDDVASSMDDNQIN